MVFKGVFRGDNFFSVVFWFGRDLGGIWGFWVFKVTQRVTEEAWRFTEEGEFCIIYRSGKISKGGTFCKSYVLFI